MGPGNYPQVTATVLHGVTQCYSYSVTSQCLPISQLNLAICSKCLFQTCNIKLQSWYKPKLLQAGALACNTWSSVNAFATRTPYICECRLLLMVLQQTGIRLYGRLYQGVLCVCKPQTLPQTSSCTFCTWQGQCNIRLDAGACC